MTASMLARRLDWPPCSSASRRRRHHLPALRPPLRVLAFLTGPDVTARILDHLGLPAAVPPIAPARGPPADDLEPEPLVALVRARTYSGCSCPRDAGGDPEPGVITVVTSSPRRPLLYSIGHSTRTYENLVATLQAWEVSVLVDIRHFTRSRANPQFNHDLLGRRLARDKISYLAIPGLGGRRGRSKAADPSRNAGWKVSAFKNYADYAETPDFAEALAQLLALAAVSTCAMMCAEAVWWRCHRRIVADYAITGGFRVLHIFTEQKVQRATRSPFARVDRRHGTLRYPHLAERSRVRSKRGWLRSGPRGSPRS